MVFKSVYFALGPRLRGEERRKFGLAEPFRLNASRFRHSSAQAGRP